MAETRPRLLGITQRHHYISHSLVLSSPEGCELAMPLSTIFGRVEMENSKIVPINCKVVQD